MPRNLPQQDTLPYIVQNYHLPVAIPPNITLHPFDQLVEIHFDVSLKCRAVGGNSLVYRWTHNDSNITSNNHYIIKGSDLQIFNATMSDAGHYQCIATNLNGSSASNYAKVIVATYCEFYLSV